MRGNALERDLAYSLPLSNRSQAGYSIFLGDSVTG